MQKAILFSFLTIFIIVNDKVQSFGQNSQEQINIQNQTDSNVINLFNGHNLDGWYTFLQGRENDPKNVFMVIDGMLRISGEEWGCITTNAEYSNFKITVESKWG